MLMHDPKERNGLMASCGDPCKLSLDNIRSEVRVFSLAFPLILFM